MILAEAKGRGSSGAVAAAARPRRAPRSKLAPHVPHLKISVVFRRFGHFDVFGRFRAFSSVFGRFRTFSDVFGRFLAFWNVAGRPGSTGGGVYR